MARIHVAVTAWRRYELTELTLRSFCAQNRLDEFAGVWYGLDGGYDPRLPELFAAHGFRAALIEDEHVGLCKSLEDLVRAVAVQLGSSEMQSDLLLLLQDDWECVRRLPLEAIAELLADTGGAAADEIGTVRLYGRYKERGKRRMVDDRNHGLPGMPRIEWANREVVAPGSDGRVGERVLVGRAYWGQPPSITRLPLLLDIVKDARHERHSMRRSAEMGFLSAWLMDPVFYHTGAAQPTKNLGGHW